jgi:ferredoxin-NADP reductase
MILRVSRISPATPASRLVWLDLGAVRFRFRAGQSVSLGRPDRRARKPYSIANAPGGARVRRRLEFLIKTDARGRLGPALAGIRRGSPVEVNGPLGSFGFPASARARHLVFIAGGAGIAPLRAMLQHAIATGYRGRVTVVYSARSARHFAYLRELRGLARQGRMALRLTVTRRAPVGWRGDRGRIDRALLGSIVRDASTRCFVCGPAEMVAAVASLLGRLGLPARRIRTERWAAS